MHAIEHGVALEGVFETAIGGAGHVLVKRAFVSSAVANIIFVKYYAIAAAVLLYFDYLITLPEEIRRIWGAKFTGATVLFLLNRYIPMAGYVVILVSLFNPPWTLSVCDMFAPFPGALNTFSQGIIMIILVLRTYALYERRIWVLVLTTSIGMLNIGIGAWAASAMTGELFTFKPIQSCVPILQVPEYAYSSTTIPSNEGLRFAWVSTFLFDILIFGLTVKRAHGVIKRQANPGTQSSLARLIMRDGSLFFLVMAAVNALNFVLFTNLTNAFFSSTTGTNSLIAHVVSVCLMNRLMINLRRESDHYHEERPATTATNLSNSDVFSTRIVGNLTSELVFTGDDDRDELDEYLSSNTTRRHSKSTSLDLPFTTRTLPMSPTPDTRTEPWPTIVDTKVSRPSVMWGDGVASSSRIGPSSYKTNSHSRARESVVESPTTVVEEYPLQIFPRRSSTLSPVSDETCVGSYETESKLYDYEGAMLEDMSGKGKRPQSTTVERRSWNVNDIYEELREEDDDEEKPG